MPAVVVPANKTKDSPTTSAPTITHHPLSSDQPHPTTVYHHLPNTSHHRPNTSHHRLATEQNATTTTPVAHLFQNTTASHILTTK
ncbi:hypothetical protein Hanom_Chr09g00812011 [Helianthus anomalus]